ncbi:APC family permease [Catellatospora chokoriensis]|uniref:Amino acid permease n=1 Tax=Catellatospora chokoriensis TaxID=310353 RepID=A0A8J3JSS6_9ACTN|nr:APC family permease [Catellatospora chokoriensis]GIF90407.1 amino acid permease [Catellatospora chokoriensis]
MTRATLAQGKLGPAGLWIMAVVASSPLTVQVGGIPTMYAATGVAGVPLAFVLVGCILFVLAVAYTGAAGHIRHAAPLYALMGRGISPVIGVAAGACALVGYMAIGTSLYGLIGPTVAGIAGGGPWWAWSAGALAVVAGLGLLGGMSSARFLGALLAVEVAVIGCYIVAALVQRQGSLTWQPFAPSALVVPGMAGAVAFAMAAFVGVETVPAYAEEARGGSPAVRRAMLAAIAFGAITYAAGAWAMAVHVGPGRLELVGSDAALSPLQTLTRVFGPGVGLLATALLATSVIAAIASFHAAGSRYLFAMAREGILPARLATVSKAGDGGTPAAASLTQTALAGAVLAGFAILGADPLTVMFTWLSTLGAVMLLALLVAASWAALRFFSSGQGANDSVWVRRIAPVCGSVLGALLIAMMLSNLGSLLGLPPGSRRWLIIPALVAATAAAGLVWGVVVRLTRPSSVAQVGRIVADPISSRVARLGRLGL